MVKKGPVRIAFLDRDGVINRKKPEGEYVSSPGEFVFLPGALDAIRKLKESGWLVVVVTNQRCVAKGIVSVRTLESIHEKMASEVKKAGGAIDAVYCCPHEKDARCGCRKPAPGMILKAFEDLSRAGVEADRKSCFIIGDSPEDIRAGVLAGIRAIKVGARAPGADAVYEDLRRAVDAIGTAPREDFSQDSP